MSEEYKNILGGGRIYYLMQAVGAGIICAIVYIKDFNVLKHWIAIKLGELSVGIYLVHFPVLLVMRIVTMPPILFMLVSFFITILFAALLSVFNNWMNNKLITKKIF